MLCFFGDVVTDVVAYRPYARRVTALASEAGTSPVWEIEQFGQRLAVLQPGVGDEGTSHHYMEPGPVAEADPAAVATLVDVLRANNVEHTVGRSWTTDAIYRETRSRMTRRTEQGCRTVAMEAAATL